MNPEKLQPGRLPLTEKWAHESHGGQHVLGLEQFARSVQQAEAGGGDHFGLGEFVEYVQKAAGGGN